MRQSAAQGSLAVPGHARRGVFLAVVAVIAAAGVEQGITSGTLSRMLDGMGVLEAKGGLLLTAFSVGIVLASFATALIIRPVGDCRVMAAGAALAAAAWVAHAACRSYAAGLPLFFLGGLGHGAMISGATAAAAGGADEDVSSLSAVELTHRRSRRISFVQAFYMLGLSAGALAGGYAAKMSVVLPGFGDVSNRWAAAFMGSAAFSVLAALFMLFTIRAAAKPDEGASQPFRLGVLREVVRVPGVSLVMAILFLDICCEAGLGAWLSRHLQVTWRATPQLAGWAVSLSYAGIAGGRVLFGVWSPRTTLSRALLIAAACCAGLTFLLALAPPLMSLGVAALLGAAIALIVPYGLAIIRERCPQAVAGAATSASLGVACLGSILLPWTMGAAAQWTGSWKLAMLIPAALFAAIAALAAVHISRERQELRAEAGRRV